LHSTNKENEKQQPSPSDNSESDIKEPNEPDYTRRAEGRNSYANNKSSFLEVKKGEDNYYSDLILHSIGVNIA
jgi:hypothetical protein